MDPQRFGKYLLLRKLTVGGMGEIFLAKQCGPEGFEKLVVIKRLLPQFCSDPQFIEILLNEARLAAQLRHPNIAQIYDLDVSDGIYYVCMEYVDGLNLRQYIHAHSQEGSAIRIESAVGICAKVFTALDYAHERALANGKPLSVVHQDVSPANILLSREGEVKLIDFGLAKAALFGQETTIGVLRGKFPYMSPEHVAGHPQNRLSDIYAGGVILYETLTGEPPFKDQGSPLRLLTDIRSSAPPDPRGIRPDIPEDLAGLVTSLLAKDPADRPQSAREVRDCLERTPYIQTFSDGNLAEEVRAFSPEGLHECGEGDVTRRAASPLKQEDLLRSAKNRIRPRPLFRFFSAPGTLLIILILLAGGILAWRFLGRGEPKEASSYVSQREGNLEAVAKEASDDTPLAVRALPKPQPAELSLRFTPSPALLSWDGVQRTADSPTTLSEVEPGVPHVLRLEAKGHVPEERRMVMDTGENRSILVKLIPAPSFLSVLSDPAGANLWINGKQAETKTPTSSLEVVPGKRFSLRLAKKGYRDWSTVLRLEPGASETLQARLEPLTGGLRIDSTPWADVFLDGEPVGGTPFLADKIQQGMHSLKLINRDRDLEHSESVNITAGETLKKRYRFTGKLDFAGIERGLEILLNGERVGVSPIPEQELPVGTYALTLREVASRTDRRLWVHITPNKRTEVLPLLAEAGSGEPLSSNSRH